MTPPIVVNIPGAKLLSSELSKNARIHRMAKAKIVRLHRDGANLHTARALSDLPGYRMIPTVHRGRCVWMPCLGSKPGFKARRVTLTRSAPASYSADGDNLATLLSSVRDGVADALGVNDKVFITNPTEEQRNAGAIAIEYHQIDGPWGLRIEIEATT